MRMGLKRLCRRITFRSASFALPMLSSSGNSSMASIVSSATCAAPPPARLTLVQSILHVELRASDRIGAAELVRRVVILPL